MKDPLESFLALNYCIYFDLYHVRQSQVLLLYCTNDPRVFLYLKKTCIVNKEGQLFIIREYFLFCFLTHLSYWSVSQQIWIVYSAGIRRRDGRWTVEIDWSCLWGCHDELHLPPPAVFMKSIELKELPIHPSLVKHKKALLQCQSKTLTMVGNFLPATA